MQLINIGDIVPLSLRELYEGGCIDHPCTTCNGRSLESSFKRNIQKFRICNLISKETSDKDELSFAQEAIESSPADLKEFGVHADEPDLFSSENETLNSEDLLTSSEDNNEDDDLEIPAFLRRQKN